MDVGPVLESVREHYCSLHGGNITINCQCATGNTVIANELLYDVFSNLVGNAIKHSNGWPVIDIGVGTVRENGIESCRITVEDNGPGIPDDLKTRIFNELCSSESQRQRHQAVPVTLRRLQRRVR
jgi:signal transduction histidine kinase